MRQTVLRAIVSSVATLGALVATAAPASASWSECSNDYICLWGNNSYAGAPWFEKKANGSYNTGYWDNDETSSVANRSDTSSVYLYNDTNTSSSHGVVCLPREHSAADLNETTPEFDDRISSLKIFTGACSSSISSIGYPKYS